MDEQAIRSRVRQILREKAQATFTGQPLGGAYSGGKAMLGRNGRGRKKGGAWYDFLDPQKNGVANAFDPNKNGFNDAMKKVGNEFTNPNSILRGQVLPAVEQGAKVVSAVAPFVGLGMSGGKRKVSPKMKRRGAMVKSLMRSHGMTLPQASAYIKASGMKF